jgi:hypothetical protein
MTLLWEIIVEEVSRHATVKCNVDLVAVANQYNKKIFEELMTRTFF